MPKDANGTELNAGDNVTLIKDLKVKGTGATLKRGTMVKNIKLTDDDKEIEGKIDKIGVIVLKTEFLKKAQFNLGGKSSSQVILKRVKFG